MKKPGAVAGSGLKFGRNAADDYGLFHTPQARGFSSGHDS